MTDESELLQALADEPLPVEDARAQRARREKLVPALGETIVAAASAKRRNRRVATVVGALSLAAALALVSWRVVHHASAVPASIATAYGVEGESFHVHGAAATLVGREGEPLATGDRVTTSPTSRARVATPAGLTLELLPASDVHVDDATSATVEAGHVAVFVPAPGGGRHATVALLGALIEIDERASFTVDVDRASGELRVKVDEGSVHLRTPSGEQLTLGAGDAWPPPPRGAIAPAPTACASVAIAAPPTTVVPSGPRVVPVPTAPPSSTSNALGEQNRLLQGAIDARRKGDPKRALALLDELLAKYPSSPLTQGARAERFRALEQSGAHDAAVKEARAYLDAYPQGFARDEAAALAR